MGNCFLSSRKWDCRSLCLLAKGYYHPGKIPLSVPRALVTLQAVWSGKSWRTGSLNTMLPALTKAKEVCPEGISQLHVRSTETTWESGLRQYPSWFGTNHSRQCARNTSPKYCTERLLMFPPRSALGLFSSRSGLLSFSGHRRLWACQNSLLAKSVSIVASLDSWNAWTLPTVRNPGSHLRTPESRHAGIASLPEFL